MTNGEQDPSVNTGDDYFIRHAATEHLCYSRGAGDFVTIVFVEHGVDPMPESIGMTREGYITARDLAISGPAGVPFDTSAFTALDAIGVGMTRDLRTARLALADSYQLVFLPKRVLH